MMNKSMFQFGKALALCFLMISAIACSSDDDINEDNDNASACDGGEYGLTLTIPIPGTSDFSYYTFSIDDIMSGTITAEGRGIEQTGYYQYTQIDDIVYSVGGLDNTNVAGIFQNSEGCLDQFGDVSFGRSLSDLVKGEDNTLVSVSVDRNSDIITFRKFNQNTLAATETVETQVSALSSVEDAGLEYTGMVISGDHLFLSYYKIDPNDFNTNYTDQAEVAVFSYPELEFEKVITDDRVGPIGGFTTKTGLIKDTAGNVYAISHSNPANGFSQSTKPAGILKINSGKTTFDEDYFFDAVDLTGGTITHAQFLNDGELFVDINTQVRASQAPWTDSPLKSGIIDLEAKTVDFIEDVPEHTRGGRKISLIQNGANIYTTITEEEGIFIYQIDTQNLSATKGAELETSFVGGFYKF